MTQTGNDMRCDVCDNACETLVSQPEAVDGKGTGRTLMKCCQACEESRNDTEAYRKVFDLRTDEAWFRRTGISREQAARMGLEAESYWPEWKRIADDQYRTPSGLSIIEQDGLWRVKVPEELATTLSDEQVRLMGTGYRTIAEAVDAADKVRSRRDYLLARDEQRFAETTETLSETKEPSELPLNWRKEGF